MIEINGKLINPLQVVSIEKWKNGELGFTITLSTGEKMETTDHSLVRALNLTINDMIRGIVS